MKNEHKRVKHGQRPGDVGKGIKIAMREGKAPLVISSYHTISAEAAKTYCQMIKKKGKRVQRRRDEERIAEELD